MHRPCLVLFISFAVGVVSAVYTSVTPTHAVLASVVSWVFGCLSLRLFRCVGPVLVLIVGVAGFARARIEIAALPSDHLAGFGFSEAPVWVVGRVTTPVDAHPSGGRFGLSLFTIERSDTLFSVSGAMWASCRDFNPGVRPGDRVRSLVKLTAPPAARNPGAFDYARYLRTVGYHALGRVSSQGDLEILERNPSLVQQAVTALRTQVRAAVRGNLSGAPAALLDGVLLGDKRLVPETVREQFSRSGVSHVLAVSGLHVGLVAAGVYFLVRSVGGGHLSCSVGTTIAVWVYALMTGVPASVLRAASVATVVVWSKTWQRQIDGLNALGLAGLLILATSPLSILGLGFQLSFAATGGILLLHRPLTQALRWINSSRAWQAVAAPVAVSIAAQLATAPMIIGAFGQISVIATLANLVVVPLMSGAVGIGLLTVLVGSFSDLGGTVLNAANWGVLSLALYFAALFAAPEWAAAELTRPPLALVVAFFSVLLAMSNVVGEKGRRGACVIVTLVALNVFVWGRIGSSDVVVVRVLDVGQGDGVLVSFPNGRHLLVDGGIAGYGEDAGERVILPALRYLGIAKLDAVVASHPHADHVGGLVTVLDRVPVGHYLESGQFYGSRTALNIQRLIRELGVRRHVVAAGDTLAGFGEASVTILHPKPTFVNQVGLAPEGLNNGSVVVRVSYRGQSLLLTGDIEHETDAALIAWGRGLESTVLKAPHHGSRTSSSRAFLAAAGPRWVAISCGVNNKFRHPSPEVLDRYREAELRVLRTDLGGCLTFRLSEAGIEARTYLK